ncbi:hypothetical protein [Actinomadura rugatobispora]|uniref:Uncharacterized protein n=1 Tax=Actinomadura rugatobispora TaxID=1994 RepID=A0ABW0ZVE7_9ACTN|nr:hypothetical protein GCM10010200_040050 [Actinomadura rugatobispora]
MNLRGVVSHLGVTVLVFAVSMLNWLVWLGWDQKRDVQPDGIETGPYQAWQVVGLAVVLLGTGAVAVWGRRVVAALAGSVLGTALAAGLDWSRDDGSGLWVIGVTLLALGVLGAGGSTMGLASALVPDRLKASSSRS